MVALAFSGVLWNFWIVIRFCSSVESGREQGLYPRSDSVGGLCGSPIFWRYYQVKSRTNSSLTSEN